MEQEVIFDLMWLGAVVGFFLPLVTSFVKQASWSTQTKRILALILAVIAGVVMAGVQGQWVFDSVGEFAQLALFSITDVYVLAAVVYRNFWADTAVERSLESVGPA